MGKKDVLEKKESDNLLSTLIVPILVVVIAIIAIIAINNNVSDTSRVTSNENLTSQENTVANVQDFSELKVEDLVPGTGTSAELGKKIKVRYVGKLADGTVFDSTNKDANGKAIDGLGGEPIEFTLSEGGLIKGWTDGIPGMKVGGQRKLTIPSSLGYGATGNTTIPGGAGLIFDVELIDVQNVN